MPDNTAPIQAAYDQWAAAYESDNNPTRDLSAQLLRQQGFDLQGKTVLEIGCGTGFNTLWLAQKAAGVLAVDFSEGMLQQARTRITVDKVQFHSADLTEPWLFAKGNFDFVFANLVLEHIQDLEHIFKEASRALGIAGLFYLCELHPYKQLQGSKARYKDTKTKQEVPIPAFQHSTAEFINGALSAGFALKSIGEWQQPTDDLPRLLTLVFERI